MKNREFQLKLVQFPLLLSKPVLGGGSLMGVAGPLALLKGFVPGVSPTVPSCPAEAKQLIYFLGSVLEAAGGRW